MSRWEPQEYLERQHPDVRVVDCELPSPMQGCVSHEKRTIWLATGLDPVARRCTLAYEIAQLQIGPAPDSPCLASVYRRAAEEWAALMLIPGDVFVAAWGARLDLPGMAAMVGVDLATFRARIRATSDEDQDAAMAAIINTRMSA